MGKWYKKVGDPIGRYEQIMVVITDKVTPEIPSPAAGTLTHIVVCEGTTVKAGNVLAVIGGATKSTKLPSAPASDSTFPPPPASFPMRRDIPAPTFEPVSIVPAPPSNGGAVRQLTPVVSNMIRENNITNAELGTIQGTGNGGRSSKKDIEHCLRARTAPARQDPELAPSEQSGTGELFHPTEQMFGNTAAPKAAAATSSASAPAPTHEPSAEMKDKIVAVMPTRKSIADHMVR